MIKFLSIMKRNVFLLAKMEKKNSRELLKNRIAWENAKQNLEEYALSSEEMTEGKKLAEQFRLGVPKREELEEIIREDREITRKKEKLDFYRLSPEEEERLQELSCHEVVCSEEIDLGKISHFQSDWMRLQVIREALEREKQEQEEKREQI